jgi:hypothetical protein
MSLRGLQPKDVLRADAGHSFFRLSESRNDIGRCADDRSIVVVKRTLVLVDSVRALRLFLPSERKTTHLRR